MGFVSCFIEHYNRKDKKIMPKRKAGHDAHGEAGDRGKDPFPFPV